MADPASPALAHGTCIDVGGAGVLLRGPSGAGKSDLALRMIDGGARLVADDQVVLTATGGKLVASAPEAIAGLLEVRGVGLVHLDAARIAQRVALRLVADLLPPGSADAPERLPAGDTVTLGGVAVARIDLAPFEASAPAKLRLAVGSGPGSIMAVP